MKLCNTLAIFHLRCFQKLLLQGLSNGLDGCKRGSFSLPFLIAQFLSQICSRMIADFFSSRMTVASAITVQN